MDDNDKLNKNWTIAEILRDRVFFIYFPLAASFPFIGTGLMFHQIYIFDSKGWTMQMIGNGYILFGLFSILGLLIGGPLIDKINTKSYTVSFSDTYEVSIARRLSNIKNIDHDFIKLDDDHFASNIEIMSQLCSGQYSLINSLFVNLKSNLI